MEALADVYTIPQENLDLRDTIRQIARERRLLGGRRPGV